MIHLAADQERVVIAELAGDLRRLVTRIAGHDAINQGVEKMIASGHPIGKPGRQIPTVPRAAKPASEALLRCLDQFAGEEYRPIARVAPAGPGSIVQECRDLGRK